MPSNGGWLTSVRAYAAIALGLGLFGVVDTASAVDCPGNANALGTHRVMTIDPADYPRLGTMQYHDTLPLADKEVVLTFDDGPMPPYTNRVLEILAYECVKANYFIVGRMARGYPDLARRIYTDGHVVGTHSENHPLAFDRMPLAEVRNEIETGIASANNAIRMPNAVAPFFRIPGLLRADGVENYLRSRKLTTWSADITGDDWMHLHANEVVQRVMARLQSRGKGIILLHDIQPATALALPELLRQLKARGYRVVQVAPANRERREPLVAQVPTRPAPVAAPAPESVRPIVLFPATTAVAPQQPVATPPVVLNPEPAPPVAVAVPRVEPDLPAPPPLPDAAVSAQASAAPALPAPTDLRPQPAEAALASTGTTEPPQDATRPLMPALKPAHSVETSGKLVLPAGSWPRAEIGPNRDPWLLTTVSLARAMAR